MVFVQVAPPVVFNTLRFSTHGSRMGSKCCSCNSSPGLVGPFSDDMTYNESADDAQRCRAVLMSGCRS